MDVFISFKGNYTPSFKSAKILLETKNLHEKRETNAILRNIQISVKSIQIYWRQQIFCIYVD